MSETGRQAMEARVRESERTAPATSHPSASGSVVPTPAAAESWITITPERLIQRWDEAYAHALAYLVAVGIAEPEREQLARAALARAASASGDAIGDTLEYVRLLVMEAHPATPHPWDGTVDAFTAWRLDAALSSGTSPTQGADARSSAEALGAGPHAEAGAAHAEARPPRFRSAPPLHRGRMVPDPIERRVLRRLWLRLRGKRPDGPGTTGHAELRKRRRLLPWTRVAARRRALLGFLVFLPSVVASGFMVNVLPRQGGTVLEVAIVVFFGALFSWISIGFWTALFGFVTLMRGRERFAITNVGGPETGPLDPAARTAIVMPICAEPVERVFAGLRAIHDSLERVDALRHFHFFVLSDTADIDLAVREEASWFAWCREVAGFDRIFYRRRRVRLRRKSGNVADFCRRWGRDYRYMIMLDADSIMAGDTLVRLVRMMESRPDVGMIQTAPAAVNRRSLFARVTQFGSRVYGPMFAAGLHYWQLGDGQYWGHNAIIRVAPFMAHCALPRLPGKPPLGGEILSHDFVEAALMGRAGWTLWLAYDLDGSYEEVPSTLLEEMKRDRRWCQGNLQHLRLLFTEGLFGAHRALFLNGVLSYVSALLWFTFLSLSTTQAIFDVLHEPNYFPSGPSLFPQWPIWRPNWARALLAVTGMILFLPKFLSVVLIVFKRRETKAYGGLGRLSLSVLLEILVSSLLAPIRMVFHSRFVLLNLLGRTVTWGSQGRDDTETGWAEAIRHHGIDTIVACVWGGSLFWLNPSYFWWVMPIIGALILSVPLSVVASRVSLGERTRAAGLFLIPEETDPPRELREVEEAANQPRARAPVGFARAAVEPALNALHRALLGAPRAMRASIRAWRGALLARALVEGPVALAPRERAALLRDPSTVDELHRRVWVDGTDEWQR